MLTLDIENASNQQTGIPSDDAFAQWVNETLAVTGKNTTHTLLDDAEVSIRIVSTQESQTLNNTYRGKDKPTNVLSFPSDLPDDIQAPLLGDIVICEAIVRQESTEQGKPLQNHWAHLTVHGLLHLLGFDHINDTDAEEMETLEVSILAQLDISNPYAQPRDLDI